MCAPTVASGWSRIAERSETNSGAGDRQFRIRNRVGSASVTSKSATGREVTLSPLPSPTVATRAKGTRWWLQTIRVQVARNWEVVKESTRLHECSQFVTIGVSAAFHGPSPFAVSLLTLCQARLVPRRLSA